MIGKKEDGMRDGMGTENKQVNPVYANYHSVFDGRNKIGHVFQ